MIRSLETRWLKLEKWITVPEIVICPTERISGNLFFPNKSEVLVGSRYYDLTDGLMILSQSDAVESVIAHEMRHQWQYFHGWSYDGVKHNHAIPFKEAIINFFTSSKSEMDALKYELLKAPCDYSLEWYDWIAKAKEGTKC